MATRSTPNITFSARTLVAAGLAQSLDHNPDNLEGPLYAFWQESLSDVYRDNDIVVAAQFPFTAEEISKETRHISTIVPDFAGFEYKGPPSTSPVDPYPGISCIRFLGEVKRYPFNGLSDKTAKKWISQGMTQAQTQLELQAVHVFMRFPNLEELFGIAAVGFYFTYATITPALVLPHYSLIPSGDQGYDPAQDRSGYTEDSDFS